MEIVIMRDGQRMQARVFVSKFVLISTNQNVRTGQLGDWGVIFTDMYRTEREARRVAASFGRGNAVLIHPVAPYNYAQGIGPVEKIEGEWRVIDTNVQF